MVVALSYVLDFHWSLTVEVRKLHPYIKNHHHHHPPQSKRKLLPTSAPGHSQHPHTLKNEMYTHLTITHTHRLYTSHTTPTGTIQLDCLVCGVFFSISALVALLHTNTPCSTRTTDVWQSCKFCCIQQRGSVRSVFRNKTRSIIKSNTMCQLVLPSTYHE